MPCRRVSCADARIPLDCAWQSRGSRRRANQGVDGYVVHKLRSQIRCVPLRPAGRSAWPHVRRVCARGWAWQLRQGGRLVPLHLPRQGAPGSTRPLPATLGAGAGAAPITRNSTKMVAGQSGPQHACFRAWQSSEPSLATCSRQTTYGSLADRVSTPLPLSSSRASLEQTPDQSPRTCVLAWHAWLQPDYSTLAPIIVLLFSIQSQQTGATH